MDSLLFLAACVGLAWIVVWSLRDFSKPSQWFWPFDGKWMDLPTDQESGRPWQRKRPAPGPRRR